MGVEPFLLSSSLVGVLAQRLVRTLCEDCRESRPATKTELDFLEEKVAIVYESKGCDACANSGFKGRTGIYELLDIDEKIRELIHEKSSEQSILKYARTKAPGIREDGKAKVLSGATTVSEILRVTLED